MNLLGQLKIPQLQSIMICLNNFLNTVQKRIQNPFKHLKWSVLRNRSTTLPSWHSDVVTTLLQRRCWRCHNVAARSKMTVVSFWRCDNVALQRCQEVASTLLQRRHNIKHCITLPFYYGLFWFLSLHRNLKVTKVLNGIKHASFLFKKTLYL